MRNLIDSLGEHLPSPIKEGARTALTRASLVVGRVPKVELLGAHLMELFRSAGVNCVLDVGAHRGQYARFLRNLGFRGRIVSFEPIAENFAIMQTRSRGDAEWHSRQLALGEEDGERELQVAQISQFSSFLAPSAFSLQQFGGASEVVRREKVQIHRLDSILDSVTAGVANPVIFLKMDTQGHDLAVFRGAEGVLDRIVAVQSEMSITPLYEGMPTYVEAMSEYVGRGFGVTGMFPVLRNADLTLVEIDCVLRRTDSTPRWSA